MSAILDELQQVFGFEAVGDRFLALRREIAGAGPLGATRGLSDVVQALRWLGEEFGGLDA